MTQPLDAWPWTPEPPAREDQAPDCAAARAAARCLGGPEGETLIRHLRAATLERALGPDAPDAALRHLEGQRQLVRYLLALVERGRHGRKTTPVHHQTEAQP